MTDTQHYKICPNCGARCASRFCPDCGQRTDERRLDSRTFFIGLASGLSRINHGFLYTAGQLLVRPWRVIRDYIHCRRVRYTPPVSMLIIVCFISTFIAGLFPSMADAEVAGALASDVPWAQKAVISVISYLMDSMLASNIILYVPALLAIPVVYWRMGARRYNAAEYLTAMLYMASAFILFGLIISPLRLVSEFWCSCAELVYSVGICFASMYRAFPAGGMSKRVGAFLLYLGAAELIYVLLVLAFGCAVKVCS